MATWMATAGSGSVTSLTSNTDYTHTHSDITERERAGSTHQIQT